MMTVDGVRSAIREKIVEVEGIQARLAEDGEDDPGRLLEGVLRGLKGAEKICFGDPLVGREAISGRFEDDIYDMVDRYTYMAVGRDRSHTPELKSLIASALGRLGLGEVHDLFDRLEERLADRFPEELSSSLCAALEHRFAEVVPGWPI